MLLNNLSLPLMTFMAVSISNMIGDALLGVDSKTEVGSTFARFLQDFGAMVRKGAQPPQGGTATTGALPPQ